MRKSISSALKRLPFIQSRLNIERVRLSFELSILDGVTASTRSIFRNWTFEDICLCKLSAKCDDDATIRPTKSRGRIRMLEWHDSFHSTKTDLSQPRDGRPDTKDCQSGLPYIAWNHAPCSVDRVPTRVASIDRHVGT